MEMFTTIVIETAPQDTGRRIDTVLAAEIEDLTRSRIQQLLAQGLMEVRGKPVAKNYRLQHGDIITCMIPQPIPYEAAAEPIPLEIIYEDCDVIVVNKPRGMVVHPAPGHYTGTLVNALLYHCGDSLSGVNGELRPGIVHRIDRDTSGLLVAAKNDRAHRLLSVQLAEHTMERTYHAIARGLIKENNFSIHKPVGRHPVERKKMSVLSGRPAVTHIMVLEHLGHAYSLIAARLETGRTHQIRVHLASCGYPLLGDTVYGGQKQAFGIAGQILHAKTLGFIHPSTGEPLRFETDWPPYFTEAVKKVRG